MPDVFVALSTFNGERHLADQLESLRRQTVRDWTLLVRDDGSTNRTLSVLERFSQQDARVRRVLFDGRRLGPALSFGRLLEESLRRGARAVFLCDQDDVWLPDKMERQLERLIAAERHLGRETPLLVHSDLTVVDEGLNLLHPSFLASQRLRHLSRRPLETLTVQNFATGCTMLVNRALLEVALPIPTEAVMHDWWLALCAAGTGRLLFEPQPTVLYRQHGANAVGAKGYWVGLLRLLTRRGTDPGWNPRVIPAELDAVLRQAEAAAGRLADFNPAAAKLLAEFVDLWRRPPLPGRRLSTLRRLRTRRLDPLRHFLLQTRLYLSRPGAPR